MGALRRWITPFIRRNGIRLTILVLAACTLFAGAEAPSSKAALDGAWRPGGDHAQGGRIHPGSFTVTRPHPGRGRPAKGHLAKGHLAKGHLAKGRPAKGRPAKGPAINPAWRHPRAPSFTWSRYMDTVNPNRLSSLGCILGRRVAAGEQSGDTLVVLDFGMPEHHKGRFGASLFGGPFANTIKIGWGLQAYARGFVRCSAKSDAHLELAGGTSNYGPDVTFKHGRMWGNMVNRVNRWLRNHGMASRVTAAGANDIEPGWRGPDVTRFWINGYKSATSTPYYYYGGAAGCPPFAHCLGDWTLEDVWYAAWGSGVARPLPEIYADSGANAEQWYNLSLYSYQHHGRRMDIAGVMTQIQSCRDSHDRCWGMRNRPGEGWTQLWTALNRDPRTAQPLRWLTDIAWRN